MKPIHRFTLSYCAAVLLALSALSHAETDFFSSGPGAGAPDSLCDVWQYKFNGWGLSPTADEDNDGTSNQVESVAGTDPYNPSDCIKIGNVTLAGNSIVFNFPAEAGKRYSVHSSSSPAGPTWTEEPGFVIPASENSNQTIIVTKPAGDRKFYKLESRDVDSDGDGANDWAEREMGTNPNLSNSPNNASGGAASDGATLASLLSLTAAPAPGEDVGYERVDRTATTPTASSAKIHLVRTQGTMQLTLPTSGIGAAPAPTKGSASGGDYSLPASVTIPMGGGVPGNPYVVNVNPVQDAAQEVPEYVEVSFELPGVPMVDGPSATVAIAESNPEMPQNRRLYVAYLGREAGAVTTASGIATALVEGDNDVASVALTFSNLSSLQNTAYIRINPVSDQDVRFLGLGQVSGVSWPIRAAHTKITDQQMLDALAGGQVYVDVTTENYPDGEIYGFFGNAVGSEEFDPDNPTLDAPAFGDPAFTTVGNDAIERDIWRFMGQSTFGGTTALYNEIRAEVDAAPDYLTGLSNWLDKQMDPGQTPSINFMKLVMAADNEEFMLRGNKPITFGSDPQFSGAGYNVTYDANGVPAISTTADNNRPINNYPQSGPNRRREWWTMILQAPDQVRQRMTLALSEILVISEADQTILDRHYGAANYWDMLATGAFGKYRTLLEQVTYSPMMGIYLSHMSNRATYDAGGGLIVSPDENYAREIMQLFSIGLVLRHPDGSLVLDEAGLPIPTYDQTDITELARVMTGWSHGARNAISWVSQWNNNTLTWNHQSSQRVGSNVLLNGGSTNSQWFGRDDGHLFFPTPWIYPMKLVGRIGSTVYHDFNQYVHPVDGVVSGVSKRLMDGKHGQYDIALPSPALPGATGFANDVLYDNAAALDMTRAHNALAGDPTAATYPQPDEVSQSAPGHTNTPINISRWLIQRLVTSNPSNGYIYRVQEAYRSSNGNLGSVMKAILLDYEARSLQLADSSISQGKVKEPLVAFAAALRAMRAFSGAPLSILRDNAPPFSASDSPMPTAYPSTEYAKFSTHNQNPPSLPNGWAQGPFRYRFGDLTNNIGQSPQRAPSVFNWFLPDYVKPGALAEAGLFAPELQISTESNDVAKINYFYNFLWSNPVGSNTQPGTDSNVADFFLANNSATAAAMFSINGQVGNTITFNSSNWNADQTVTVTAVNNSTLGNLSNGLLRFNVTGDGTGYDGIVQAPEAITVLEDELPNEAIMLTNSSFGTWVVEGGATDTVNVRLSAPPPVGVTVTLTPSFTSSEATASPATLNFTNATWNTNQTFTITAANDTDVENQGTGNDTLTVTSASTAANFNGLTATLPVNVTDNDGGQGIIVAETSGGTAVIEGSGSDTYTVRLASAPSSTATVAITATGGLYLGPTGTNTTQSLTFSTSNWSTTQTVTVRANDDTGTNSAEGSYPANPGHIGRITHSCTTGGYNVPVAQAPVLGVPITDNDERIIMVHSGGETRVSEDGTVTDTFTVRLRTAPTTNVTVSFGSNTVSCDPPFLTFTTGNFNVDQTVTVRANDDSQKQGLRSASTEGLIPITATATASIASGGITNFTMTNVGGGYTSQPRVTFSGGGGTGANAYALVSPQGTITGIQVVSAGTGYTSAPTVVIDPPPFGGGVIIATATSDNSADTNYNNYWSYTHSALKVSILDNDLTGLLVTQTGGSTEVGEGNSSDTYSLALSSRPSADVTVSISPAASAAVPPVPQVTTDVSSVTFTPANWNTPQTVTVSGFNDATVEGNVSTVIYHTIASSDKGYNGLTSTPLVVTVIDNDLLPLTITHLDGFTAVAEGGLTPPSTLVDGTIYATDNMRLRLPFNPTSNVTVNLLHDTSQITVTPSTLTFTSGNGTTDQTVTVAAVNDAVAEATPHETAIRFHLTSADARYNNPANIPVIIPIQDDDSPGIIVAETDNGTSITLPYGGNTRPSETGTDTFFVTLSSAPASNVVLSTASSNTADFTVSPATLTFTPANWSTRQTVTITAIGDQVVEDRETGTVTVSVVDASSDNAFDPLPDRIVPVWITNNQRRNESLLLVETGGDSWVAEGGKTDDVQFFLSTRPDTDVVVTIDSNAQLSVSQNTFVFTPSNWNVPQSVAVTAIDDATVENNHNVNLQFRCNVGVGGSPLLQGDARWLFVNPVVRFDIIDNDGIGVEISESGGDTRTIEGGSGGTNQDTYTVRLSKAPNGNVAVNCTTANSTAGQTVSPTLVTFTPANWNVPQTVTITATNDTSVEGYTTTIHNGPNTHTYNINHSINTANTTDTSGYAALTGLQAVINFITDDDIRIITRHTGLDTRVHESGASSDTYEVVLRNAPTANVTVNVAVAVNQGIQASPTVLTFTPSDWATPQMVTVSGLDNALNDRVHTTDITHTSASSDAAFNAQTVPAIRVNVLATDVPQIVLYESSSTTVLSEGGVIDDYYVGLSHAPTANVTVTVTPDAQQEVGEVAASGVMQTYSPSTTFSFTPTDWVPRRILIRAVDDLIPEAIPHLGQINHSAASADARYNGITMAGIPTFITDNELHEVRITQSGGTTVLSEAGATDTYDVRLTRAPTADVTVTIVPGSQASIVSPGTTLTFTTANWNINQTVTVAAVNDASVEGNHTATITHTAASSDSAYGGIGVPSVTASITDNDGPQLVVTHSGGSTSVTEGNSIDTFTIRLNQAPTGASNVTITLVPPLYIIPVPAYGKQVGYYTGDIGGSNQQRDRIVMDFAETMQLYRDTFYDHLESIYGVGSIPGGPSDLNLQNAHWAATKALVDKLDIWFCGGSMKARHPVLIEPNQPLPDPLPGINPRQVIMEALYYLNGGNNNLSTTRYEPEIVFNPKAPPNTTFANEIRDRARWASYLMATTMPGFVAH